MARLYRRKYHLMSVPKTPVYENRRPIFPHHDVGFPRHALHAEAVAVAVLPQPLPHALLGRGVLTAYPRHAVMTLLGSHRVRHDLLPLKTDSRMVLIEHFSIEIINRDVTVFIKRDIQQVAHQPFPVVPIRASDNEMVFPLGNRRLGYILNFQRYRITTEGEYALEVVPVEEIRPALIIGVPP